MTPVPQRPTRRVCAETWKSVILGDLTTKIGSGITPRGGSSNYLEYGRPFVRSQNVGWGNLLLDDLVYIDEETHRSFSATELEEGDVLLNITGASIGRTAVVSDSLFGGNVNQHVCIIRVDQAHTIPQFINYVLLSSLGQKQIDSFQAGGNRQGLNFSQVRSIKIDLPPTRAEQEAIAGALSDADALIESLEQLLTKKRQIKQGAMQELLTGKRRLPGFKGEWEKKFMSESFAFGGGFSASREQLSSDGHPYLHYGDIHTSTKTYIDVVEEQQDIPKLDIPIKKISTSSLLADGDIVFVDASEDEEGTSKHVVVKNVENVPFISGLHTIVAKSKSNDLANEYKKFCFQTLSVKQQFRFYSVGTKVSGISKSNIGKISLPIPRHKEQLSIAEILSDMDAEIVTLEEKLTKAKAIKQGMMQELLTGRIRLV